MLTIGAFQAGTEVFRSQFLFHGLMCYTYGEGFSLLSAEGSAAAHSVHRGGRGMGALFRLTWHSEGSGEDVDFLLGVRVVGSCTQKPGKKALKVFSPEDMFPVNLRLSLNVMYQGFPKAEKEGSGRRHPCVRQVMIRVQVRGAGQPTLALMAHGIPSMEMAEAPIPGAQALAEAGL